MEGNAPNYMESYWLGIEADALKLLETARRELGKIAAKESTQLLLSLDGEDDHIIDGYLEVRNNA